MGSTVRKKPTAAEIMVTKAYLELAKSANMISANVTKAYCRKLTTTGTYLKMGMRVSLLKTP